MSTYSIGMDAGTLEEIECDPDKAGDRHLRGACQVARRLGMGRSTLYRKIRDHGLEVKRASHRRYSPSAER
ncbi:MAG: helix-turn-helix domain-containing protein [Parvularculaceae bacterium]